MNLHQVKATASKYKTLVWIQKKKSLPQDILPPNCPTINNNQNKLVNDILLQGHKCYGKSRVG